MHKLHVPSDSFVVIIGAAGVTAVDPAPHTRPDVAGVQTRDAKWFAEQERLRRERLRQKRRKEQADEG
jgi:hypothetical protein